MGVSASPRLGGRSEIRQAWEKNERISARIDIHSYKAFSQARSRCTLCTEVPAKGREFPEIGVRTGVPASTENNS
jgi:hypothetical protein